MCVTDMMTASPTFLYRGDNDHGVAHGLKASLGLRPAAKPASRALLQESCGAGKQQPRLRAFWRSVELCWVNIPNEIAI